MTTSGFTIIRNAVKLEYPFRESVLSALPLCDEFIINCGDSNDGTREICQQLQIQFKDKIRVLDSLWEVGNQFQGFQLKAQTDRALAACTGSWCLYIQADEVFHEADYADIRKAQEVADSIEAIDGALFHYLHFYGNYQFTIHGRNWYRREVRLFKNGRGVEAFRDAQGFRKQEKRLVALDSQARVFHYGYVRSLDALREKAIQMSQWWGETPHDSPEDLIPRRHLGIRTFKRTHPAVMKDRLQENDRFFNPLHCRRTWNRDEFKNAITLLWESVIPFRIGEFRNYEVFR